VLDERVLTASGPVTARPAEPPVAPSAWRLAHETPHAWKSVRYVRDLFLHLVSLELRLLHKRSRLGVAWTLANPVVQLLIFTVVLGRVLVVGVQHYPLFLCCGLLCWNAFSESLTMAAGSIANAPNVLYQPGFRPVMMPVVVVATGIIHFVLSLSILGVLLAWYRVPLGWPVLALPLVLIVQSLLTLALAMPLAALMVSFDDTRHLLSVALRFLFFLTPIVYATDNFPRALHLIFAANPLTHLVRAYRAIFLDGVWPDWVALGVVAVASLVALFLGYRFFESWRFRFIEEIE
jgi:lipopolysaccharide transport system permease protein